MVYKTWDAANLNGKKNIAHCSPVQVHGKAMLTTTGLTSTKIANGNKTATSVVISSFRKSSTVAKGRIKKWIQLLIATGLTTS